jgi:hypothetical protein
MSYEMDRRAYAETYEPTVGDRDSVEVLFYFSEWLVGDRVSIS